MITKRKTLLCFFVCLILAMIAFATVSCGETIESESQPPKESQSQIVAIAGTNGLEYTLSEDQTYYIISGYNGTSRKVVCGDYYKGLPIKEIGDNAFRGTSVETVNVTDGIEKIGEYAFFSCKQLSTVNFGNTVVEIGDYAFSACSLLTNVILPEGFKKLCDHSFFRSINLISVSIPESISYIGCGAFEGCTNLQYSLYDNAQYLGNTNNKYVALINYDLDEESCAVNVNTKVVAGGAFENSIDLISVTVASGVVAIGDRAFNNCFKLSEVALPNTLETIGTGSFAYCSELNKINLPSSLKKIGDGAFSHSGLTTIYIPDGVEAIEAYTFNGCSDLASIELGVGIKRIGSYAFNDCVSLYEIVYKDISACQIEKIGAFAFYNCINMPDNYFIPASVKHVDENAFLNTTIRDVFTLHTTASWQENHLSSATALEGFTIYFYSETEPTESQEKFFHFDQNGKIVIW